MRFWDRSLLVLLLTASILLQSKATEHENMTLFGHGLVPGIVALKREVEALANSRGYIIRIVPLNLERPRPHHGITRFVDRTTIEIAIAPDQTNEIFNLVLGEELIHAYQNIDHFPKVIPQTAFDTSQTREFSNKITTTVYDVHAHRELRRRGLSTQALGMEIYEADREGFLRAPPPQGTDDLDGFSKFQNALIYVRLFFELHQNPDVPTALWDHVNGYYEAHLPKTRELGRIFITVIDENGFDNPAAVERMFREMTKEFKYREMFYIFGGPPEAPAYIRPL